MKRILPLSLITIIVLALAGCGSSQLFTQQKSAPSEGAIAYEENLQEIPEMPQEKSIGISESKLKDFTKKAHPLKVLKKAKDFTKTVASTAFDRLQPKDNAASDKSKFEVTLGQILIVVLIIALLAVLVGGSLGELINLLVSILIVILLVLLILWLLGSI